MFTFKRWIWAWSSKMEASVLRNKCVFICLHFHFLCLELYLPVQTRQYQAIVESKNSSYQQISCFFPNWQTFPPSDPPRSLPLPLPLSPYRSITSSTADSAFISTETSKFLFSQLLHLLLIQVQELHLKVSLHSWLPLLQLLLLQPTKQLNQTAL